MIRTGVETDLTAIDKNSYMQNFKPVGTGLLAMATTRCTCHCTAIPSQASPLPQKGGLLSEHQCIGQVAHGRLPPRLHGIVTLLEAIQHFQLMHPANQAQNRSGVIHRVIHRPLACER